MEIACELMLGGVDMEFEVRKLESDSDKKGKAYVHWKSWHEAYSEIVSKEYLEKLSLEKCEEMAFRWPDNTYVALDWDKVVGFACYYVHDDDPKVGEINAIYVLADYYGTGVAQKLMEAGLSELSEQARVELWVLKDNPRAISFYKKFGFTEDGTEQYLESISATEIRMVKG